MFINNIGVSKSGLILEVAYISLVQNSNHMEFFSKFYYSVSSRIERALHEHLL